MSPIKSRLRRLALLALVLVVGGLVASELFLRLAFGLGDPPLYLTDSKIEYMLAPGVYHRFGHTISVNAFSMRSPEVPEHKADPRQLRVLVIGDSVVNGGVQTDDADLATALVGKSLSASLSRPVLALNISAGSWGPPNELAWLQRFGTFDADVAVLVLNSLDWGDVPTFAPLAPDQPTRKPVLALQEILNNYGPRFAPFIFGRMPPPADDEHPTPQAADASLVALRDMVLLLRSRGIKVTAIFHPRQTELASAPLPGREHLAAVLRELNVPIQTTDAAFRQALTQKPAPYRDDIHPSIHGQQILADLLGEAVKTALAK